MHSTASPGPDGFGPFFFKSCWQTTSAALSSLLVAFHDHRTDLSRINQSYLVLLPKKDNARHPQDFRPIALQNTPISKILTTRL
jgi:hypothetical protein